MFTYRKRGLLPGTAVKALSQRRSVNVTGNRVVICDGRHIDRVNLEQMATHGLAVRLKSLTRQLAGKPNTLKWVANDGLTVAEDDLKSLGWAVVRATHKEIGRMSPTVGIVYLRLLAVQAQSATLNLDEIVLVGTDATYAQPLRLALQREITVTIVARSDLLSASLLALTTHPLARTLCLRDDLRVAV